MQNHFNQHKDALRESLSQAYLPPEEHLKECRKIRNWQSHMNTHLSGFIGFGKDANANSLDRAAMDKSALKYVTSFCKRHNVELLYLVRHEDETTVHYHFLMTNYNYEHCRTLRFCRDSLRKEQDAIGEAFKLMGLSRGVDKHQRLNNTAERLNLELVDGRYDPQVWEQANVIHRSVKKLHEDLPLELASLQDQKNLFEAQTIETEKALTALENELAEQHIKKDNNERYLANALRKIDALENEVNSTKTNLNKLIKNTKTYQRRAKAAQDKIGELVVNITKLNVKTVEVITGYKKNTFSKDSPIIIQKKMVELNEALRFNRQSEAVHIQKKQEQKRLTEEQQATALLCRQELEAYFTRQAYKYLLVFGKPIDVDDKDNMLDFIRWHETDTGWTSTKQGTRFKVQKHNGEVIRVVVEANRNATPSDFDKARTLRFAVIKSGMKSGVFTGSNKVLLKLWNLFESETHPFELKLNAAQQSFLIDSGVIKPEPELYEPEMNYAMSRR